MRSIIHILLLFIPILFGIEAASQDVFDYCDSQTQATVIDITVASVFSVTQSTCVQYFHIPKADIYLANGVSLMIEIMITQRPSTANYNPILVVQPDTYPILSFNQNFRPRFNGGIYDADLYGFSNQKDYHHLYLNSSALSLATTGSVYLGFYQSFATSFDSPLEYKISMTYAKDVVPCPYNCSGAWNKGVCGANGKCVCNEPYIGEYCEIEAYKLDLFSTHKIAFSGTQPQYGYILWSDMKDRLNGQDFFVEFTKDINQAYNVYMIFTLENEDYPPNPFYQSFRNQLSAGKTDVTLQVGLSESDLLKSISKYILRMDLLNNTMAEVQIQTGIVSDGGSSTGNTIMIILVCVACLLVLIWGLATIIKYKIQRTHQNLLALQAARQAQQLTLLPEDIEKYLPVKKYPEMQKKENQQTCAICLEEFTADTNCRQVPVCLHIFHDKCIDEWLAAHENCPFCKAPLKKYDIEKFFRRYPNGRTVPNNDANSNEQNQVQDKPASKKDLAIQENPTQKIEIDNEERKNEKDSRVGSLISVKIARPKVGTAGSFKDVTLDSPKLEAHQEDLEAGEHKNRTEEDEEEKSPDLHLHSQKASINSISKDVQVPNVDEIYKEDASIDEKEMSSRPHSSGSMNSPPSKNSIPSQKGDVVMEVKGEDEHSLNCDVILNQAELGVFSRASARDHESRGSEDSQKKQDHVEDV